LPKMLSKKKLVEANPLTSVGVPSYNFHNVRYTA
jgi:hypothetical protein